MELSLGLFSVFPNENGDVDIGGCGCKVDVGFTLLELGVVNEKGVSAFIPA